MISAYPARFEAPVHDPDTGKTGFSRETARLELAVDLPNAQDAKATGAVTLTIWAESGKHVVTLAAPHAVIAAGDLCRLLAPFFPAAIETGGIEHSGGQDEQKAGAA